MGSKVNPNDREYRMSVIADPDGGYVVDFPDLPGCMTQVESLEELAGAATEAKALWIEAALSQGLPIPDPTYPEALSGKFNVRLPKSLHRALVDRAEAEGVSLNQLVVYLLAQGIGTAPVLARAGYPAATPTHEQSVATGKVRALR